MLLNKSIKALSHALPKTKDNDTKFALDHVHITKDCIEVTNSHSMYWMSPEKDVTLEDYPDGPYNEITEFPILIPHTCLAKALKNVPKKNIAILEMIAVQADAKSVTLITTDLNTMDKVVGKANHKDLSYPDTKRLREQITEEVKDTVAMHIAAEQLGVLVKVAKELGGKWPLVTFAVPPSPDRPVGVTIVNREDDTRIDGIVMPMLDNNPDESRAKDAAREEFRRDRDLRMLEAFEDQLDGSPDCKHAEDFLRGYRG